MSYEKMTAEKWVKNLIAGKFASASGAKKSIAKTGWHDRVKDRARQLTEQHFDKPGSVRVSDLVRKNGNGAAECVEEPAEQLHRAPMKPMAIKTDQTTARLMGAHVLLKGCREALETLRVAHELYPEADVSEGMMLVDKVLPKAVTLLVRESEQALAKPAADQSLVHAPPGVPPIVPNFTPEQKEAFDKAAPRTPLSPFLPRG